MVLEASLVVEDEAALQGVLEALLVSETIGLVSEMESAVAVAVVEEQVSGQKGTPIFRCCVIYDRESVWEGD